MLYELTKLSGSVFAAKDVRDGVLAWLEGAAEGVVLSMLTSDIGDVGELIVVRQFESAKALATERHRALVAKDPFGSASARVKLRMESFAPFPFLPDPVARAYGGVFELRTYHLTPGGLPGTMVGWEAAIRPAHAYTDHLVTAMYALDGAPRITHIWGFSSVEERVRIRREHYAAGLWPPKGGPERIEHATSTIAFAEPGLPVC